MLLEKAALDFLSLCPRAVAAKLGAWWKFNCWSRLTLSVISESLESKLSGLCNPEKLALLQTECSQELQLVCEEVSLGRNAEHLLIVLCYLGISLIQNLASTWLSLQDYLISAGQSHLWDNMTLISGAFIKKSTKFLTCLWVSWLLFLSQFRF